MDYGQIYDDHVADTYDEDALGLLAGVRGLAIAQIAGSALPGNATILDLGVGTGQTLTAIAPRFPEGRMIGIDLSPRMVAAAQRKLTFDAHVDDACNAGRHVPAQSIDLVIAHFLTTFVHRPTLFRTAHAALKSGGLLSVVSTTSEAFHRARVGVDQLLGSAGIIDQVSPSPETGDLLRGEIEAAGFEIRAFETFRRPILFSSFDETLTWGLQSGFFTHAVEAIGFEKVRAMAPLTEGMFPFPDEYVSVAILAASRRS